MIETGFGGGGYAYTLASVPSAPLLEELTDTSVYLTIVPDGNPPQTNYTIENVTEGTYVDADGSSATEAVWQKRDNWGTVTITGLAPSSLYQFRLKARNTAGIETDSGPIAEILTINAGTATLGLMLTVSKASSTISAPLFMRGLSPGIRIAGKDLHELALLQTGSPDWMCHG